MLWSNCMIIFTQKVFKENCVGGEGRRDIERVRNPNNYFLVKKKFFFLMWERNSDQLPLALTLTGAWTRNLGMCPDWGSNPQPFGLQDNAPTNWATLARAGKISFATPFALLILPIWGICYVSPQILNSMINDQHPEVHTQERVSKRGGPNLSK